MNNTRALFAFLCLQLLVPPALYAADEEGITPPETEETEGSTADQIDIADMLNPKQKQPGKAVERAASGVVDRDPGDTWLGRTANAPAPDSPEEAEAKRKGEEIFENYYRKASPELMNLYSADAVVTRVVDGPKGEARTVTYSALERRDGLTKWLAQEAKEKGEIEYSMPAYRVEEKNVRVLVTRSEENPHRVIEVNLLIGPKVGDEWVILEDQWRLASQN